MSPGDLRNICSQSCLEAYHCCEWISPAACLTRIPLECLKIIFNRTCSTLNSHTFTRTVVLLQFLPHDSFITLLPTAQTDPKELSLTCLFLPHLRHPNPLPILLLFSHIPRMCSSFQLFLHPLGQASINTHFDLSPPVHFPSRRAVFSKMETWAYPSTWDPEYHKR